MDRFFYIISVIWRAIANFARTLGRGVTGVAADIGYVARYTGRGIRLFAGDVGHALKYLARYTWRGAVGYTSDARRLATWGRARAPAIRTGAGYAASTGAAIWAGAFSVMTMTVRILALIIVVTLAISGALAIYNTTKLHTHFDVRTSVTFNPFGTTEPEPTPQAVPEPKDEGTITRRNWHI